MLDPVAVMTFYSPNFPNEKAFVLRALTSKLRFFFLAGLSSCRKGLYRYRGWLSQTTIQGARGQAQETERNKGNWHCLPKARACVLSGSSFNGANLWAAKIHLACNELCSQWPTVSRTERPQTLPRNPALTRTLQRWVLGSNIYVSEGQKASLASRDSWLTPRTQLSPLLIARDGFLRKDHPLPSLHPTPTHTQTMPCIQSFILSISTLFSFSLLSSGNEYMEMKMINCFAHNRFRLYKPHLLEINLPFFFGNSWFSNLVLQHPQKVSCWWSLAALFLNMPRGSSSPWLHLFSLGD